MQFKGQNQPQRQTAKEVIAANVPYLIKQLEQGRSEALTAYLNAVSRFHNYFSRQHPRNRTTEARCNPRRMGMSYGGKIVLLPGQSKAEEFSTLVHELAHEMLHKTDHCTTTTKVVRETEAEAIAFMVSKAVGLQTGTASVDYIQLYHGS